MGSLLRTRCLSSTSAGRAPLGTGSLLLTPVQPPDFLLSAAAHGSPGRTDSGAVASFHGGPGPRGCPLLPLASSGFAPPSRFRDSDVQCHSNSRSVQAVSGSDPPLHPSPQLQPRGWPQAQESAGLARSCAIGSRQRSAAPR
ncbi:hypothetical protein NDU88_002022 [Pleurodeles waltl]|uniref:Uncharacterized protein n=1 Tax=Pleurodeles waltl TaxID=8319 RepID=A0AAV7NLV9_PLEWA|nr:hypothetical protein NDU88_002022 [Pleurodeles waltl]